MIRLLSAALALVLAAAVAVPAAAQVESREAIALQNQILELRRDLEALRAGGAGRLPPPSGSGMPAGASGDVLARLVERVQALEEQVRSLRGRVDEIDNRTTQMRADLDKQRRDLEFRLDQLEGRAGGARPAQQGQGQANGAGQRPAQGGAAGGTPADGGAAARPQGADAVFTAAQTAFRANQFAESERLFRDFARQYANDRRAPEAYWGIGQSLLNRREWAQAALAFDESFRRFPRGAFAQESLLGLGNALAGLGDRTAACEAYGRLASQFATNMKPGIATALGPARQRANCR
jgi:TolA-binding protein